MLKIVKKIIIKMLIKLIKNKINNNYLEELSVRIGGRGLILSSSILSISDSEIFKEGIGIGSEIFGRNDDAYRSTTPGITSELGILS